MFMPNGARLILDSGLKRQSQALCRFQDKSLLNPALSTTSCPSQNGIPNTTFQSTCSNNAQTRSMRSPSKEFLRPSYGNRDGALRRCKPRHVQEGTIRHKGDDLRCTTKRSTTPANLGDLKCLRDTLMAISSTHARVVLPVCQKL